MSDTLKQIKTLIVRDEVRVSDHGYDELAEDGIFVRDRIVSVMDAELLKEMSTRHTTKLVQEGKYVAEVDVELTDSDTSWPPYPSLDNVRSALRRGDIKRASSLARVYELKPVASQLTIPINAEPGQITSRLSAPGCAEANGDKRIWDGRSSSLRNTRFLREEAKPL